MRRRLVPFLAGCVTAWLFGYGIASIPSPADPNLFWVANFSSPWVVLPFIAGALQPSWRWAVGAGVGADVACVCGFYGRFLTMDPLKLGLAPATPPTGLAWASLTHWLGFAAPWIVLAVATGLVYGILGRLWGRSGSPLPWIAVSLPFLIEPLLWRAYEGHLRGPGLIWVAEVAVGVAILVSAGALWRRRLTTS
jgi:hypothetical protein